MRSWDELGADLLEHRMVTRVGMEKVEEQFVLHLDQVRRRLDETWEPNPVGRPTQPSELGSEKIDLGMSL